MAKKLFYSLYATDGFIDLPTDPTGCLERRNIYVFGFVGGLWKFQDKCTGKYTICDSDLDPSNITKRDELRGTAVIPSPLIKMDVDDELFITFTNLGLLRAKEPILDVHSIHIHGGHVATQLDGVPETSFGVPVTPIGKPSISITYYFKPETPGSYFYHCHQEAAEHVQMGMYGGLIVYPAAADVRKFINSKGITNRNFANSEPSSFFDKEYVILLSDIDSRWHDAVQNQTGFNPVEFRPDWWLVNGRAFPDTLLPSGTAVGGGAYKIPAGYDSYVHIKNGQKFLLRLINMGYQPVPWHTHGWHGMIVNKDAHPNMHMEKVFTQLVGSGESYDLLFIAEDKRLNYEDYIFCGKSGFPPLMTQVDDATKESKAEGTFMPGFGDSDTLWANTPEAGGTTLCPFPGNFKVQNYGTSDRLFFPQFYIAHNHDDYKVTNNGVYPGGQLIFIQTDLPKERPYPPCGPKTNQEVDDKFFKVQTCGENTDLKADEQFLKLRTCFEI
ncbi:multicopper oxidase domain-containing protein [Desnuesiella massiliensis]|uniref:multicopper oxidase domain-containing protein n=1 Tax=Desnuesiella massiliensis TaxID=1650662 RepID=UPI0009EBCE27|nr:multicopper oxidase domain-containing protein [Desnuesiella massiliensis]